MKIGKRIAVERKLWSGLQKMTRGVVRQADIDGHRVDFFVPSAALAICIDDDYPARVQGVRRLTHAAARARGITLLVVEPSPVLRRGGAAWAMIARALDDAARSRRRGTISSDARSASLPLPGLQAGHVRRPPGASEGCDRESAS